MLRPDMVLPARALARAAAAKAETTFSAPKAVEWFTATLSSDTQYFDMRLKWALMYLCLAVLVASACRAVSLLSLAHL